MGVVRWSFGTGRENWMQGRLAVSGWAWVIFRIGILDIDCCLEIGDERKRGKLRNALVSDEAINFPKLLQWDTRAGELAEEVPPYPP